MSQVVLSGLLATLAAIAGALWTVGGRAAWLRREISRELDIAQRLPDGEIKQGMAGVIEERVLLYLGRRTGPGWKKRPHLLLLGLVIATGAATVLCGRLVDWVGPNGALGPVSLGVYLALVVLLFWLIGSWVLGFTRDDSVRLRADDAARSLARVRALYLEPTGTESEAEDGAPAPPAGRAPAEPAS